MSQRELFEGYSNSLSVMNKTLYGLHLLINKERNSIIKNILNTHAVALMNDLDSMINAVANLVKAEFAE